MKDALGVTWTFTNRHDDVDGDFSATLVINGARVGVVSRRGKRGKYYFQSDPGMEAAYPWCCSGSRSSVLYALGRRQPHQVCGD